jgi:hypothetical protein
MRAKVPAALNATNAAGQNTLIEVLSFFFMTKSPIKRATSILRSRTLFSIEEALIIEVGQNTPLDLTGKL